MIDDGEFECQTMNCFFGKYKKEDNFYEETYKEKHNAELSAINATKPKLKKEIINENITTSKRSSMDK